MSNAESMIGRELVITRIFDAPRELVWQAWTDPKHVANWWGPNGFTNPLCEWNAKKGSAILIHMRGPAGTPFDMVMPMKGTFLEVIAPEKLVFTGSCLDDANGNPQLENLNTITLEDLNGKTKMTLHVKVIKATPAAAPALEGMEQGWSESFDRLAVELMKIAK
jgi:uncharacterized protein YndB with AHSA1/START domain